MANFEVPENPEFTEDIRKLETTDPGHANIFNAVFEPIINNVLHVKKMITDHMMAKNPHGIKPADLGLENVENKPMGELSTEFTVAKTRANIQSKQDMKTILGMLAKWYTDLKSVAWTGKYTDLTDKPTIPSGAAASCAVANNDTTTEPGSVADARIVRQHGLEIDELNRDFAALNDSGAIKGMDAREDGVYITYTPATGADAVTKKLGSNIQGKVIYSNSGNTVNSTLNRSFTYTCSESGFYLIIVSIGGRTSAARGTISINGVTPTIICNNTTSSATAIFSTSYAAYFEVKQETKITVSAYSDNGKWEADSGAATNIYLFQFT